MEVRISEVIIDIYSSFEKRFVELLPRVKVIVEQRDGYTFDTPQLSLLATFPKF